MGLYDKIKNKVGNIFGNVKKGVSKVFNTVGMVRPHIATIANISKPILHAFEGSGVVPQGTVGKIVPLVDHVTNVFDKLPTGHNKVNTFLDKVHSNVLNKMDDVYQPINRIDSIRQDVLKSMGSAPQRFANSFGNPGPSSRPIVNDYPMFF